MDACLQFLDPKVEHWPAAVALCLLRIGLECTGSKMRVRPSMEMVSKYSHLCKHVHA